MKRAVTILAVSLSAACFNPDYSSVQYVCDEANPYCPDGLSCIEGQCLPPDTEIQSPEEDGGIPDLRTPVAGCASGSGTQVGTAFACPGRFTSRSGSSTPSASQLCAAGYTICTNASGIDLARCRMLSGFFAASAPMRRGNGTPNPSTFACGTPTGSMSQVLWAGCGVNQTNTVFDLVQPCQGFGQAVDCVTDNRWSCFSANLSSTDQENAANGVLCCK